MYEKTLHELAARRPDVAFPGLGFTVIGNGTPLPSDYLELLARDTSGVSWVIELKRGSLGALAVDASAAVPRIPETAISRHQLSRRALGHAEANKSRHDPLLKDRRPPCPCTPSNQKEAYIMTYFHPEEEFQVAALERHAFANPGARYLLEFADDESYLCEFDASWESENTGDLDIEMDDPLYDEFYQVGLHVLEVVQVGQHDFTKDEYIAIDYRDFPAKITDVDTGTVIYQET